MSVWVGYVSSTRNMVLGVMKFLKLLIGLFVDANDWQKCVCVDACLNWHGRYDLYVCANVCYMGRNFVVLLKSFRDNHYRYWPRCRTQMWQVSDRWPRYDSQETLTDSGKFQVRLLQHAAVNFIVEHFQFFIHYRLNDHVIINVIWLALYSDTGCVITLPSGCCYRLENLIN